MPLLYWFEDIRNPVLDSFFSTITYLGSETLFIVVALIIYWCVNKNKGYYLMTVGFFGTLLNQFLKLICRVPRPWVRDSRFTIVEAARADATGYSFPSGHTQSVTCSLGCTARSVRNWAVRIVLMVLIALTAISRMYLGVHTPADVGVSLLLSVAMIFLFNPIFENGEAHPGRVYAVMSALFVCSVAYVIFNEVHAWPAEMDRVNLKHGIQNGYLLMGCSAAMVLSYYLEQKFIRFDTQASLSVQILKVAVGLVLVLAIKSGLKPVLNALFGGHPIERAIRYFAVVMFAACVWPLTFGWLRRRFSRT